MAETIKPSKSGVSWAGDGCVNFADVESANNGFLEPRLQPEFTSFLPESRPASPSIHTTPSNTNRLLSRRFGVVLVVMQIFGFYSPKPAASKRALLRRRIFFIFWFLYICFWLSILIYLTKENIKMIILFEHMFELLHAQTISSIVNGAKPLIVCITILLFLLFRKEHENLLAKFDEVDQVFACEFQVSPNVYRYSAVLIGMAAFNFVFMLSLRLFEMIYTGQPIGQFWLIDLSIIIVPSLSSMLILPLIYLEICNRMVRFWCRQLSQEIYEGLKTDRRPMRFYYDLFLKICNLQAAMSKFFNPLILFYLGWSMFSLCLTVYFLTQVDELFPPAPPIPGIPQGNEWAEFIGFSSVYGGMQVVLACACVVLLCCTGTATNETTRGIFKAVLSSLPQDASSRHHIYITCFSQKLSSQHVWGVTVCQLFCLERNTFMTLLSMMVGYAVILSKFRGSKSEPSHGRMIGLSNINNTLEKVNGSKLNEL